ncbi:MAG: NAD(+) synthase, partial [Lachnospiraceae bacterium]|nr:NAD(+) synthase [Lachnospiraceae bacterium]
MEGFFRVAACAPNVAVADTKTNAQRIKELYKELIAEYTPRLAVFPEMSVTAYTCADLFHNSTLLSGALTAIKELAQATIGQPATMIVGAPIRVGDSLYNCAVVLACGKVQSVIPKTYLPNYNEFYEKRWWHPAPDSATKTISICGFDDVAFGANQLLEIDGVKIGVEICEDLWTPIPPSSFAALSGAQILANLSASDDLIGKYKYLNSLIEQQSARCLAGYAYASAGYGESSTDLVFDGKTIIAENGYILSSNLRWNPNSQFTVSDIDIEAINRDRMHHTSFADCATRNGKAFTVKTIDMPNVEAPGLLRHVDPHPFVPPTDKSMAERCDEIINIQAAGLAKRLSAIHCTHLVIGISGGLDSTLALLVAVKAFNRLNLDLKGIIGITMPGLGTSDRTKNNAWKLMEELGITAMEIPIAKAVQQHFADIGQDPETHDVTYENSQARERTQILMDYANKVNGIVLGTGDLSELALGWATYNGDHMSMYAVNCGVPKTLVKYLVQYFAYDEDYENCRATLLDIIDTPISPELTPTDKEGQIAQKTEDLVGPYELHDFFLYYTLRYGFSPTRIWDLALAAFDEKYDQKTLHRWLREFFRRFFQQQFKRSCLPDGPKVGTVCLSPRGDWR